jgi:hypothetical protein
MDWIFDNFNILAIVGIALASWLKARADAKAAEREEREARELMGETEEETFGPEEEWREAQPPLLPSQPPPLVVRPAAPPPIPAYHNPAEAELQRQLQLQEKLTELRATKAVTTGGATAARTRAKTGNTTPATPAPARKLRTILRQRGEIRQAVILREVLGPPLSLR